MLRGRGQGSGPVILDIFNYFMPAAYFERPKEACARPFGATMFPRLRTLWDVDARLRLLDQFGEYQQVLSLANPPREMLGPPGQTPDLARIANDELAELCRLHPQRFPTFIASPPTNNIDASLPKTRVLDVGGKPACRVEKARNVVVPGNHQRRSFDPGGENRRLSGASQASA